MERHNISAWRDERSSVTSVELWKPPQDRLRITSNITPFMNLPPELVHNIADFLDPSDIALFSLVCRFIRDILRKRFKASSFTRTDYFAYLAGLARGLPDQWLCESCMALHPITRYDPHMIRYNLLYPVNNLAECPDNRETVGSRGLDEKDKFGYQEVQLALKYTRLQQNEYSAYLADILEPYHRIHNRFDELRLQQYEKHQNAHPRIITDDNGNLRFLLFSTWHFLGVEKPRLHGIHALASQMICPHLRVDDWPVTELSTAVKHMLMSRDEEFESSGTCHRCATDFLVRKRGVNTYIDVWQDLGPECSPMDIAWRSQSSQPCLDGVRNGRSMGPTLYHEPGSIRKLYERHEPGQEACAEASGGSSRDTKKQKLICHSCRF
ncbi:hypothetical protein F4861DRAFT_539506 [Xylaria intraflava]|nr:hypothetical protein F4861DRAFT_539506 [Xylaria intraflava]